MPQFSSTKSLTGHSLGATGVQEAIYCLLMMKHNFICAWPTSKPRSGGGRLPLVPNAMDNVKLNHVISNSFGFGGTNATSGLLTS